MARERPATMEAGFQRPSAARPHVSDAAYTQESKHGQSLTTTARHENNDARSREIPTLRHKVDRHIVPIMFLCYLMNFIDKVALNVRLGGCNDIFTLRY